jgi:hypothetical protein
MTAEHMERVFGRGRLKMATGEHVEVFREAVVPGERRRYTKRFLATDEADFGLWTEREWRILARLIGHGIVCVPDVVQFDGGATGGMRRVQTYDAGVTVDQWATLLPVSRDGVERHSIFEDCAHWWALAHQCLAALNEIHALQLVHLDVKGDNICIPYGPAHFDPDASGATLYPMFARLSLIDFAFSLVSGERLGTALPIGWQKDYDYQSPRLLTALEAGRRGDLRPTQELDWRCDFYSLAAMLKRYLPDEEWAGAEGREAGWMATRYDDARALIYQLRECHDRALPDARPHQGLMDITGARTRERDLADSLVTGWSLSRDAAVADASTPITPLTRIAPLRRAVSAGQRPLHLVPPTAPTAVVRRPRARELAAAPPTPIALRVAPKARPWRTSVLASGFVAACALAAPSFVGDPAHPFAERLHEMLSALSRGFAEGNERIARSDAPDPAPQRTDTPSPNRDPFAGAPATAQSSDSTASSNNRADVSHGAAPEAPTQPSAVAANPAAPPAVTAHSAAPKPSRSTNASSRIPSRSHAGMVATRKSTPATGPVGSRAANRTTTARAVAAAPATRAAATTASNAAPPKSVLNPGAPPAQTANASATASESHTVPAPSEPVMNAVSVASTSVVTSATPEPASPDREPPPAAGSTGPEVVASVSVSQAPTDASTAQASSASGGARRRSKAQPDPGGWLGQLWKQLTVLRQAPAPVEERSAGAGRSTSKATRPAGQSVPEEPTRARARPTEPPRSPPTAVAQASTPQIVTSPIATTTAPVGQALAPQATTSSIADGTAPPPVDPRAPDIAARTPDMSLRIPRPPDVEVRASEATEDALAARARRLVAEAVPHVATQAYADAYRALSIAYKARDASEDGAIVNAVYAAWPSENSRILATSIAPVRARRLHEEARKAIADGSSVANAMDIELKAFGANPRDPDIAQYLALLHLWSKPAQPEAARQLALYAIAMSGQKRLTRIDYWNTFAVASALSSRENDATAAFLVETALTTSLDRSCRAALYAYTSYGERLRTPVQAMLYRVQSHPRAYVSPSCAWPRY